MFYHQGILHRRGGKFGTVWLAATKIDKLKRRDFSSVNIRRTCDDILDYILVRIVGKKPGSGQPRFSLYLSSQLMYGVVRIYKRQSDYLLDDVTSFFCKMRIAVASLEDIDLKTMHRQDQLAIDLDELCEENPWFGTLQMDADLLKSPQLPSMEMWRVESSLSIQKSPVMSPVIKASKPATPKLPIHKPMLKPDVGSPHTVSSKEEITIPEIDMTLFQDVQLLPETDLPPFDGKQLEGILEEPLPSELQMAKYLSPVKVPQYEEQNLARGVLSPKEKTPLTKPDNGVPGRREPVPSPGITPMPHAEEPVLRPRRARPSFTLQLSPVPPSPRRQRKRRHLCIDAQIQIHKDQLKLNFSDREDIIQPFVLPDLKSSSIPDLFINPGQKALGRHPKLLQLWRRNAVYGLLETESDMEQPAWSVPDLLVDEDQRPTRSKRRMVAPSPQISPVKQLQEPVAVTEQPVSEEQPSVEVARDASVSLEKSRLLDDTPVSIHQRSVRSDADMSRESEKSKEESSITKPKRKSRTRGSTSTEEEMEITMVQDIADIQSLQESTAQLSSIMEEKEVPITPGPLHIVTTTPTAADLLRLIKHHSQEEERITFESVCPQHIYDRSQAARMFSDLLGLCHSRFVRAVQDEPYGDIYIWTV